MVRAVKEQIKHTFCLEDGGDGGTATKNFFMDIYAKEVSKMQSVSKSSSTAKKRNFDSTQFNTYGLPLGKFLLLFTSYWVSSNPCP